MPARNNRPREPLRNNANRDKRNRINTLVAGSFRLVYLKCSLCAHASLSVEVRAPYSDAFDPVDTANNQRRQRLPRNVCMCRLSLFLSFPLLEQRYLLLVSVYVLVFDDPTTSHWRLPPLCGCMCDCALEARGSVSSGEPSSAVRPDVRVYACVRSPLDVHTHTHARLVVFTRFKVALTYGAHRTVYDMRLSGFNASLLQVRHCF